METTVGALRSQLQRDAATGRLGVRQIGPVDVKGYRVGSGADEHGRGVFYSEDSAGAEEYARFHPGEAVREQNIHLDNALLAGHQNDVTLELFGKGYGDLMDGIAYRVGDSVKAGRLLDVRIAREARKRGYDGIIYVAPAPPARGEIAVYSAWRGARRTQRRSPPRLTR